MTLSLFKFENGFKKIFIFFILAGTSPDDSITIFTKQAFEFALSRGYIWGVFRYEFYFSEPIFHVIIGSENRICSDSEQQAADRPRFRYSCRNSPCSSWRHSENPVGERRIYESDNEKNKP